MDNERPQTEAAHCELRSVSLLFSEIVIAD
jgi:hypothetical protein